jgi:serine protease Do
LSKSLNVAAHSGVLVSDVTSEGPAAKAGIERGDVITAVDGAKTTDSAHLRNLIALAGKDKKMRIDVLRAGNPKSFEVSLGELPAEADGSGPASGQQESGGLFQGVTVQELDAATRGRLRLAPSLRGVLVARVDSDSGAAGMGLRPDDIILEINRIATPSVADFRKTAQKTQGRALLLVYRDGITVFLSLSK